MKTFNDVKIGDTIFQLEKSTYQLLPSQDQYGNKYNPDILRKIVIKDMKQDKDGSVLINVSDYYNRHAVKITDSEKDLTSFTDGSNVFYSCEESYLNGFSDFLVQIIRETEQQIKDFKEEKEGFIRKVREYYYEVLNPSTATPIKILNSTEK